MSGEPIVQNVAGGQADLSLAFLEFSLYILEEVAMPSLLKISQSFNPSTTEAETRRALGNPGQPGSCCKNLSQIKQNKN